MRGFFAPGDIPVPTSSPSVRKTGCGLCGLRKEGCLTPKMSVGGEGRKGILCLGEAPGEEEDKAGEGWVGKAGRFLEKKLKERGIDLNRDCWKLNAVNCRPPKNRTPSSKEVTCCRSRVWAEIERLKPKLILLFGGSAVESFLGDRWNKDKLDGIGRWRGWTIPDRKARAWVCPTFHPSYILRTQNGEERALAVETIFDQDLDRALGRLEDPLPFESPVREEDCVTIVRDSEELTRWLVWLLKHFGEHPEALCTVDLETTGLKPYREGHKILTGSISWHPDGCVAFPWPEEELQKKRLARLFKDRRVRKVAQNLPFEDRWLGHFGFPVEGWHFDTLLAGHVLDNRPGVTGLKFQAYVRFGVLGYDDDIGPWIKAIPSEEKIYGTNAYNKMEEFFEKEPNKVLLYNGMDALLEHRLALKQMGEIG